MATHTYYNPTITQSSSSQRPMAMVLALVSAVVLSPLYVRGSKDFWHRQDSAWSSALVLPVVLAGLIIAIRTASSSPSSSHPSMGSSSMLPCSDPSWVLRIGSSSWGLGGILVMLVMVLSWQHSVQEFLWK
ncbi:hypothetical protein CRG98_005338 [Punica granatum]|uniref:Uncharacterized protein n=1 Tax=Punica granatum TaxID=22663 RepID=A0A2I0L0N8_PUNGR|nr:hypothetical protein CRG98_005338 [Punica granatum]